MASRKTGPGTPYPRLGSRCGRLPDREPDPQLAVRGAEHVTGASATRGSPTRSSTSGASAPTSSPFPPADGGRRCGSRPSGPPTASSPTHDINRIRERVRTWRRGGWQGVTSTTRRLLEHWTEPERERPLYFCQIEAAETAIYIAEVAPQGRRRVDRQPASREGRAAQPRAAPGRAQDGDRHRQDGRDGDADRLAGAQQARQPAGSALLRRLPRSSRRGSRSAIAFACSCPRTPATTTASSTSPLPPTVSASARRGSRSPTSTRFSDAIAATPRGRRRRSWPRARRARRSRRPTRWSAASAASSAASATSSSSTTRPTTATAAARSTRPMTAPGAARGRGASRGEPDETTRLASGRPASRPSPKGRHPGGLRPLGHAVLPARLRLCRGDALPVGRLRLLPDRRDRVRDREDPPRPGRRRLVAHGRRRPTGTSGFESATSCRAGAGPPVEARGRAEAPRRASGRAPQPLRQLREGVRALARGGGGEPDRVDAAGVHRRLLEHRRLEARLRLRRRLGEGARRRRACDRSRGTSSSSPTSPAAPGAPDRARSSSTPRSSSRARAMSAEFKAVARAEIEEFKAEHRARNPGADRRGAHRRGSPARGDEHGRQAGQARRAASAASSRSRCSPRAGTPTPSPTSSGCGRSAPSSSASRSSAAAFGAAATRSTRTVASSPSTPRSTACRSRSSRPRAPRRIQSRRSR